MPTIVADLVAFLAAVALWPHVHLGLGALLIVAAAAVVAFGPAQMLLRP
jgi:hypothetical protein